mmetsp:Transcript_61674/g.133592  ORF Transcript_61674/g.133592 Transcript_61674/m.133592 type:complete len:249 (+) Transcript_61674:123-869(+)
MPSNASFGVFPSQTAVRSASQGDLRKLYFSTRKEFEHDGRDVPEAGRAENFEQIHSIGKRHTKYMMYQRKVAPLADRSSCSNAIHFNAKPLGDHECNRELAETFRGPLRPQPSAALDGRTHYADTFASPSRLEMKRALQPSAARSYRTKTLGGTGQTLERESNMQRELRAPRVGDRGSSICAPKPNLSLCSQGFGDPVSRYRGDYRGRTASADLCWEDYKPRSPSGLGTEVPEEIFRQRRAIFLSPGG